MGFSGRAIRLGQSTGFVWDFTGFQWGFAKSAVLICLSVHKLKFELLWGGLCVPIIHFDNLRGTVTEILAKIVGTGSIDHMKAGPNYFHQYF